MHDFKELIIVLYLKTINVNYISIFYSIDRHRLIIILVKDLKREIQIPLEKRNSDTTQPK